MIRIFAANIVRLASGAMLARALAALTVIIIARRTGPASFGIYTGCFVAVRLSSILFSLGLDNWLLRNGNLYGQPRQLALYTTACLLIKGGAGFAWLTLAGIVASLLQQPSFPPLLVFLSACCVWFDEIAATVWTGFKTILDNRLNMLVLTLAQLTLLGVTSLLATLDIRTILPYVAAQMLISALAAALALQRWRQRVGFVVQQQLLVPLLKATIPFGLSTLLAYIYGQADILIVTAWLGSKLGGIYASASSIIAGLALLPIAIYSVVLPVLSQRIEQNLVSAHGLFVKQILASAALGALLGLLTLWLAPPLARWLLGDSYLQTGALLAILSGVIAGRCLSLAAAAGVVAADLQQQRLAIQVMIALLNIGFNVLVVSTWGVSGVAAIYVLTEWLLAAGYGLLVWSYLSKIRR
jgi:O-antigen/teichoic acid export membrane protein